MPPVWKERLARVRRAVDANFGDTVRVTPMLRGGRDAQYLGRVADPDRPSFECIAILQVKAGDTSGQARPANEDEALRMPVGDIFLHVDPDTYPDILGVTNGDVVEALDRGGERFEVIRPDRRMRNRMVFRLRAIT